jgi:hypothetical protein
MVRGRGRTCEVPGVAEAPPAGPRPTGGDLQPSSTIRAASIGVDDLQAREDHDVS